MGNRQDLPKELRCKKTSGVEKYLLRKGCYRVPGSKHPKFRHPEKRGTIILPNENEIPEGTYRSILKAIALWGFLVIILWIVFF